MRTRILRSCGMLFAAILVAGGIASQTAAQTYPNRPIRLIVGYPPGGSGDFLTRVVGDEMSRDLGVGVVTENRPGAGASLASDVVAKAPPDGYTLLNSTHHAVNKILYKKLPYDPDKDFVPITRVATGPVIICVNNDLPVKNLKELIAYARANPGKLFNAASGNGSSPHLASVQFESVSGVHFTTVQYKGGGPSALSLMAGDTQVMYALRVARHPGHSRRRRSGPCRLRFQFLVRPVCAGRHPASRGEPPVRGGGQRLVQSRCEGAHCRPGHGRLAFSLTGSVRSGVAGGSADVGTRGQGFGRAGRVKPANRMPAPLSYTQIGPNNELPHIYPFNQALRLEPLFA
jgi:Tripartite tricarboxylate transporter family receptor